jgi:hypothetical protein
MIQDGGSLYVAASGATGTGVPLAVGSKIHNKANLKVLRPAGVDASRGWANITTAKKDHRSHKDQLRYLYNAPLGFKNAIYASVQRQI